MSSILTRPDKHGGPSAWAKLLGDEGMGRAYEHFASAHQEKTGKPVPKGWKLWGWSPTAGSATSGSAPAAKRTQVKKSSTLPRGVA